MRGKYGIILGALLLSSVGLAEAVVFNWDVYTWPANTTGRSFTIERSTDQITWVLHVANISSTVTTFSDATAIGNNCYRLLAKTSNMTSPPSNVACAQLPAPTGLRVAP